MRYQAILIDADDTLFDFQAAERRAIASVLAYLRIDDPGAPDAYHAINEACWRDLERGKLTQEELKVRRFRDLQRAYGIQADPREAAQHFVNALSEQAILLPGAEEALRRLYGHVKVALVTNGIACVQRGRLARSPVRHLIDACVISEEALCAKPDPRMIERALQALGGVPKRAALMVGDSLTSDMKCAYNAGVDACWLNPAGLEAPAELNIRYQIEGIQKLPAIALGEH